MSKETQGDTDQHAQGVFARVTCWVVWCLGFESSQVRLGHLYHFNHPPTSDPTNSKFEMCSNGRAICHAGELLFMFGTIDKVSGSHFTDSEKKLSESFIYGINSFIHSNTKVMEEIWPQFTINKEESSFYDIDENGQPVRETKLHFEEAYCNLFDSIGYE